jgi:uncharacterized membrane protein YfcA
VHTYPRPPLPAPARPRLWIWWLWLAGFYAVWSWLVLGQARWETVQAHWPIALTMALGSYVAGSTPMGGGTVGFPILVLLFEQPATLGRDFSFAVQSIGMVSASIFILSRRRPVAGSLLRGAMVGSLIGTPTGLFFVAPYVPGLWIKLVFAVAWASFGVLHLYRLREIAGLHGRTATPEPWDFRTGLVVGLLAGATVAAVTGVGIDMVVYAVLVLLLRCDLKVAIPTSVIIMAFNSLLGIALKNAVTGVQPGVFEHWLAAAPVVALGAPLGVFVVEKIGRAPTLLVVALLCVGQFAWTCYSERAALGATGLLFAVGAVAGCLLGFEKLRATGLAIAAGRREQEVGGAGALVAAAPEEPR